MTPIYDQAVKELGADLPTAFASAWAGCYDYGLNFYTINIHIINGLVLNWMFTYALIGINPQLQRAFVLWVCKTVNYMAYCSCCESHLLWS